MKAKIFDLIKEAAEETSDSLVSVIEEQELETTLFGSNGVLNSLGLVNLIVSIETALEDEFDVSVTLADERAMSQKNSPFRTVGTLIDYIVTVLESENGTINT